MISHLFAHPYFFVMKLIFNSIYTVESNDNYFGVVADNSK